MKNKLFIIFLLQSTLCLFIVGRSDAQTMPVNTPKDLELSRAKIDSLDSQLLKTLGERERIVKEIGIYKEKNHIPPLQAARFNQVLAKGIAEGSKQNLSPEFITELLNAIHKESLRIEGDTKP